MGNEEQNTLTNGARSPLPALETLYFPCRENPRTGRINIRLTTKPMTKDAASDFLKQNYSQQWRNCEAIPQPVSHPYFTDPKHPHFVGKSHV